MGNSESKCEFVDTKGNPCRNARLHGGYRACFAHKCRECPRFVMDMEYLYCFDHTCKWPECKGFADWDKGFCAKHNPLGNK